MHRHSGVQPEPDEDVTLDGVGLAACDDVGIVQRSWAPELSRPRRSVDSVEAARPPRPPHAGPTVAGRRHRGSPRPDSDELGPGCGPRPAPARHVAGRRPPSTGSPTLRWNPQRRPVCVAEDPVYPPGVEAERTGVAAARPRRPPGASGPGSRGGGHPAGNRPRPGCSRSDGRTRRRPQATGAGSLDAAGCRPRTGPGRRACRRPSTSSRRCRSGTAAPSPGPRETGARAVTGTPGSPGAAALCWAPTSGPAARRP